MSTVHILCQLNTPLKQFLNKVKRRKLAYFRHITRAGRRSAQILQGKGEGAR